MFNAAAERSSNGAMLGMYMNCEVREAFCKEFDKAFGGEAFEKERKELEFQGDSVKEFFFVFVNLG